MAIDVAYCEVFSSTVQTKLGTYSWLAELLEMTLVEASDFNSTDGWPTPNCKCLPGCNELSYSSTMTYGHMISSFAVNKGYMEDIVDSSKSGKE
jgi:hypothetical protein